MNHKYAMPSAQSFENEMVSVRHRMTEPICGWNDQEIQVGIFCRFWKRRCIRLLSA
jgi:hypothetical protein